MGPPDSDAAGSSSSSSLDSSSAAAIEFLFGAPEPLLFAAAAFAAPEVQSLLDPNNKYVEPKGPPTTWEELLMAGDEVWFGRKFRFKHEYVGRECGTLDWIHRPSSVCDRSN